MDDVVAGVGIPIPPFADSVPLRFGTGKGDARQTRAALERMTADARHAVRHGDARQPRAAVECIIVVG